MNIREQMMDPLLEAGLVETRRHFFGRAAGGIGTAALASLVNPDLFAKGTGTGPLGGIPHFAPKAKRVIHLFMKARAVGARNIRKYSYGSSGLEWVVDYQARFIQVCDNIFSKTTSNILRQVLAGL